MKDIRIQFVNYKTKNYLLNSLKGVINDLKNSDLNYSIAVLDNDSGDDLSDLDALFPGVEVYTNNTNVGFGAGHNILAKRGEAKYILILNPDIKIVEDRTIDRLVKSSYGHKSQVVGPRLINSDNVTQRWDHGELNGWHAWLNLNLGGSFWKERKDNSLAAWVSGAVFLIDKNWFDRLGGFDENFFLYKEEEELCWRLRKMGGKVLYNPEITIFHQGSVVASKKDHMQKSVDYFLDKHFKKRPTYHITKLINKIIN